MDDRDLRERITAQFSGDGDRADVWRGFARFLETGAFLNLGYSPRFVPHVLGSSQLRLASKVGDHLAAELPSVAGDRLLDVGCGRGGPAVHLASQLNARVTGVDLVAHNVALARENARARDVSAEFLVADATRLPIAAGSVSAVTAIDALVYVPDRSSVFAEVARVCESGGVFVCSDLLCRSDIEPAAQRRVGAFADAWDMPMPGTDSEYVDALRAAGFEVVIVEDLTPHSVGRFRRWTTPFLALAAGPSRPIVETVFRRWGLDTDAVVPQIRRAHEALPFLGHGLFVARRSGADQA